MPYNIDGSYRVDYREDMMRSIVEEMLVCFGSDFFSYEMLIKL